jgi:hypothetical protein
MESGVGTKYRVYSLSGQSSTAVITAMNWDGKDCWVDGTINYKGETIGKFTHMNHRSTLKWEAIG